MSTPTEKQIGDMFARMRKADWRKLEKRLLDALSRNRGPRSEADGYPTSVGQGGPGGSELTSVESAAEARIAGRRDQQLEHVAYAIAALDKQVQHLDHLERRLRLIESQTLGAPVEPKNCEACAKANIKNTPAHFGSLGGRLKREMHLCVDCYAFANRTGRVPSVEELEHHERTGRWKVRATA